MRIHDHSQQATTGILPFTIGAVDVDAIYVYLVTLKLSTTKTHDWFMRDDLIKLTSFHHKRRTRVNKQERSKTIAKTEEETGTHYSIGSLTRSKIFR